MSQLSKVGDFFKDGFDRFIEDFPTVKVPEIKVFGLPLGLQTSLGKVSETLGLEKYVKDGRVEEIPDLSLLTPFGMGKLLPHFKNSFFPSGEKEEISKNEKTSSSGEEKDKEEVTKAKVETSDNNEKDALDDMFADWEKEDGYVAPTRGEDGKPLDAQLGEKDTSSTSSTVSDVSSQTTYEESAAGTVVLAKPQRSDFKGRSGQANYERALIMYNNQKEMLNSYQKTQVKASLAKI